MSKFNSYARELDSLVKQLRDEYTKRLEAYDAARKPVNPCSDPEQEKIQSLRREAALREAKANYDAFCKAYPGELSAKAKEIRSRLVKDVSAAYMAIPDDVDDKLLALLNSDIISVAECKALYQKYKDAQNWTACRLLCDYAKKKWFNCDDYEKRRVADQIMLDAQVDTPESIVIAFDELNDVANRCANNSGMFEHWESITQQAIEEF